MAEKVRRTQERAVVTRAKLLDATIDSLLELGYAGTTTTVVALRAGLSRGAQLHHFPTKAELVAGAVEHLANRLGEQLQREAARLPVDGDRIDAAIDLLWSRFSGPLFPAWLELKVASRHDADLRARLQTMDLRLGKAVERQVREMFGGSANSQESLLVAMTLFLLEGMAMNRAVADQAPRSRAWEKPILDLWKRVLANLLADQPVGA